MQYGGEKVDELHIVCKMYNYFQYISNIILTILERFMQKHALVTAVIRVLLNII
jgi:hypothetical protein